MIRDDTDNVLIVRSSVSRALRSVGKGVALDLATSISQIYTVLRTGELQGIQIGGRKQWWIERAKLEGRISVPIPRHAAGVWPSCPNLSTSELVTMPWGQLGVGSRQSQMVTEALKSSEVVVHHLGH